METKTQQSAVQASRTDIDNATNIDAKKKQNSTGLLLNLYKEGKYIFLYFETVPPKIHQRVIKGKTSNFSELLLPYDNVTKTLDELEKLKRSITPEDDAFVMNQTFDDNVLDELCTECSQQDSSIKAICYTQQDVDGREERGEGVYKFIMERMKQNGVGYLEFSKRAIESEFRQDLTDTDEDSAPAVDSEDLERSPFFPDPSFPAKDPKKSSELLRILNKIRRAHNCPEEHPAGFDQVTTSRSGLDSDDLEVDVGDPGSQPSSVFFHSEPPKSKTGSLSMEQKKNDTNFRNVRYLMETPAAKQLVLMDYGSDDVLKAISKYTQATGHVEFDENDLIGIIAGEEPKRRMVAVQHI